MKEYQRKGDGRYVLPQDVYMRTVWAVRSYPRLLRERRDLLGVTTGAIDGMPRAKATVSSTERTAERLERITAQIDAIEQALDEIPPEYRRGVLGQLLGRCGWPPDASRSTYGRWKSRFLYAAAQRLGHV